MDTSLLFTWKWISCNSMVPFTVCKLVLVHLFLLYPLWCNYTNQLRGEYLVNHWSVYQMFDCCIWVVKNKVLHSFFDCCPHLIWCSFAVSTLRVYPFDISICFQTKNKQKTNCDQKTFSFWCWGVGESEILFILLFPSFIKSDNTGVILTITGVALWSVQSLTAACENIFSLSRCVLHATDKIFMVLRWLLFRTLHHTSIFWSIHLNRCYTRFNACLFLCIFKCFELSMN